MVEIVIVATEVFRDVKILQVEPERYNLTEVVVEAVQSKVFYKVVQFVFVIEIRLDEVAGIVGIDHVAVHVIHVGSGESYDIIKKTVTRWGDFVSARGITYHESS